MDKTNSVAPVIPAGTTAVGGAAYDPLAAAAGAGQAARVPDSSQAAGENQQQVTDAPPEGQGAFAELAAKKGWSSPDDMARSYSELEGRNTRVEMGLSEIIKLREQASQNQTPEVTVNPSQVQSPDDAVKVVENIVRKVTRPLQDQIELQQLFLTHPDAKQYAEGIGRAIKENPGISWDSAYKIAKFDAGGQAVQQARQEGKQEAYQTIAQKQSANVGTAKPAAAKEARPLDELIRDKSIPFREVQRIMRERFVQ